MKSKKKNYIELLKPNILIHALITFSIGYVLHQQSHGIFSANYVLSLVGFSCLAGSGATLNHLFEIESDKKMERTKLRPLASGNMDVLPAFFYALLLLISGTFILLIKSNLWVLFLSLFTIFCYVVIYTPLKKITWLNTFVGAIPGAFPPVCGWFASNGPLSWPVWVFFLIFYFWQLPHFFSIAWIHKDAYQNADFKMLSGQDVSGKKTGIHILLHTVFLIICSLILIKSNLVGIFYIIGALGLGSYYLYTGIIFYRDRSVKSARSVLKASILYQPGLLICILIDLQTTPLLHFFNLIHR
jgi:protoheme IX farnesyltransferase